jgi:hypothetical protein
MICVVPEASLVDRYYDPATGSFLSVDPTVATTTQPYVYATDDPVNNIDPSGDCVSLFNVVCVGGGSVTSTVSLRFDPQAGANTADAMLNWFNKNINPAYMALMGYYNEWQATENGCGLWTELRYGAQGVAGVAGTLGLAVGGGEIAGFIENPDQYFQIGNRGFHLHFDDVPHGEIGSHLQIDTWLKGVSGSGRSWRLPWPPW